MLGIEDLMLDLFKLCAGLIIILSVMLSGILLIKLGVVLRIVRQLMYTYLKLIFIVFGVKHKGNYKERKFTLQGDSGEYTVCVDGKKSISFKGDRIEFASFDGEVINVSLNGIQKKIEELDK